MIVKRTASLLLMSAVVAYSSIAAADTAAETEAKARVEEGNRLWQQQKHEEARLKYMQAYAVLKFPGVLFNLAQAEMVVGRNEEAYRLFRDFLKLPQTDMDRSLLARKYFADLGKKVSLLAVSEKTPKGTKIIVDGVEAGEAPLAEPIVVKPGKHDVVLRYGADEKKEPESCAAGGTLTVELLPKGDTKGPSGPVTPPPGEVGEKGSWLVPGVLAGVGLVGMGVGIGMGLASSSAASTGTELARGGACVDLASAACTEAKDKESSASGMGTGSIVGYVVGGGFLAASVISAVVIAPWKVREKKTSTLWFSPSLGGAALGGTF